MSPLLFVMACDPGTEGDFDVAISRSEVAPTVFEVSWSTEEPTIGAVRYGPDEEYGKQTAADAEPTTEHRFTVAGIPASSVWHVQAVSVMDDEAELLSIDQEIESGAAPPSLPTFTTTGRRKQPGTMLAPVFSDHPFVVGLDAEGRYNWWWEGLGADVYTRARFSLDGKAVLFNRFDEDRSIDRGAIFRVSLDGNDVVEVPAEGAHHDFVELPDGNYAYLKIDVREHEGRTIVGDSLVEVDAAGTLIREVWNGWDTWVVPDEPMSTAFYPQGEDWLHCNTLEYDADRDVYLVSVRNLSAVMEVDRAGGEIRWLIGGDDSDFALTAGTAFEHQHSPLRTATGLYVFDNRDGAARSYVRHYAIDEGSGTYTEDWTFEGPEGNWVALLGDVIPYDDGTKLMAWGTAGFANEVNGNGQQNWRVDAEFGHVIGFIAAASALGGPTE